MDREDGEISDDDDEPMINRASFGIKQERLYNSNVSFDESWQWLGANNSRRARSSENYSIIDQQFENRRSNANMSMGHRDVRRELSPGDWPGNQRQHYADGNHYGESSRDFSREGMMRSSTPAFNQNHFPDQPNPSYNVQRLTPTAGRGHTSAALRFQKPPPLSEKIPVAEKYEKWLDWKGVFDVALSVCEAQPTEQQKASLLFTSVGQETQKVITLLALPPMHRGGWESGTEYSELSRGLNSFFRGMVDESVDYARFHDAKQGVAEGIHDFTLRLRSLAAGTNTDPTSFAFRHQVLKGMKNQELAIKANDQGIPLGELIRIAARKEQREASASNPWDNQRMAQPIVATVSSKGYGQKQGRYASKRPASGSTDEGSVAKSGPCRYCGGRRHSDKKECPALGKECSGCGGKNHFVRVCEKSKAKRVSVVTDEKKEGDSMVRN